MILLGIIVFSVIPNDLQWKESKKIECSLNYLFLLTWVYIIWLILFENMLYVYNKTSAWVSSVRSLLLLLMCLMCCLNVFPFFVASISKETSKHVKQKDIKQTPFKHLPGTSSLHSPTILGFDIPTLRSLVTWKNTQHPIYVEVSRFKNAKRCMQKESFKSWGKLEISILKETRNHAVERDPSL